jgi:hypothetical protein
MVEKRNSYRFLVEKPEGRRPLERPRMRATAGVDTVDDKKYFYYGGNSSTNHPDYSPTLHRLSSPGSWVKIKSKGIPLTSRGGL